MCSWWTAKGHDPGVRLQRLSERSRGCGRAAPGVREVAAVGVPDERSGEAVKLYVIRKDPNLDAETLIAHCRTQLTGYKVPRYVEFRDDLPRTNVGKILRRELAGSPGAGQGARPGLIPRRPAAPARFDLAPPRRRAAYHCPKYTPARLCARSTASSLIVVRVRPRSIHSSRRWRKARAPRRTRRWSPGPGTLRDRPAGRTAAPARPASTHSATGPCAATRRGHCAASCRAGGLAEAVVQLRIHAVAPGLAVRQAMQHFLQLASFQPVRRPGASSARSTVGTRSTLSTMWSSAWPRVASASPDGSMTMKGTRCTVS